jgi:hypothetical protein
LWAFGSLPRSFDNKGIRHGKTGKIPSLRGAQATWQSTSILWRERAYINPLAPEGGEGEGEGATTHGEAANFYRHPILDS